MRLSAFGSTKRTAYLLNPTTCHPFPLTSPHLSSAFTDGNIPTIPTAVGEVHCIILHVVYTTNTHSHVKRELVLDYLLHNSYVGTAQVFARDSAALINPSSSSVSSANKDTMDTEEDEVEEDEDEDDMDTDEDGITTDASTTPSSSQHRTNVVPDIPKHVLAQVLMRRRTSFFPPLPLLSFQFHIQYKALTHPQKEIRHHILCGRVQAATDLLNTHFPAVLHLPDPETTAGSFAGAGAAAANGNGVSPGGVYVSRKSRANPSPVDALAYSTRPSPSSASTATSFIPLDARAARTRPVSSVKTIPTSSSSGVVTGLGLGRGAPGPPAGSPHARVGYASTVSTKPVHVALNLQVQAFIEAARTVPLPFPSPPEEALSRKELLNAAPGVGAAGTGGNALTSTPGSAIASAAASTSVASSPSATGGGTGGTSGIGTPTNDAFSAHQTELLHRAQRLYATVESLRDLRDRDVYREELKQVGGLLAYPAPERSPMARYMRQDHRESVADQVNSAILCTFEHSRFFLFAYAVHRFINLYVFPATYFLR